MIIENVIQPRTRSPFIRLTLTGIMLACALPLLSTTAARATEQGSNKYNILFFILDDIGADQLNVSNPVGKALGTLPVTPTIDAIAAQGVNFQLLGDVRVLAESCGLLHRPLPHSYRRWCAARS